MTQTTLDGLTLIDRKKKYRYRQPINYRKMAYKARKRAKEARGHHV